MTNRSRLLAPLIGILVVLMIASCDNSKKQPEGQSVEGGLDNTQEVLDYYAANPEFFTFATIDDLPKDLAWDDGSDLPDIGSPEAKKGGTYNERIQDFPRTLRLVGPDSNGSFRPFILDHVRTQFARVHPQPGTGKFEIFPELLTEWAQDLNTATVYGRLDPDARWSDGEKVTTEDVAFMFFFYRSDYLVAPWYKNYFHTQFKHVTIYDDYTFAFSFPEAKPDMAYRALSWNPIPRHFFYELGEDYVERYQWKFVPTTGPYVVHEEDIKKGRSIVVSRMAGWWGQDKKFLRNRFNFDRLRFSVVRDTPKAFEAFKSGELDRFGLNLAEYFYDKLPATDPDVQNGYIEKSTFYNVQPRPSYGLWINESKPFLDNQDVRIGINFATNFQLVIDRFFRGDAVRMRTTADGYGNMTHPTLKARPFDTDKALEHFANAGFTTRGEDGILVNAEGQKLSFTLSTGYESLKDVLTILREEALKAGLEFRIEVLDGTAAWKKVQEKKHDVHLSAFGVTMEMYPRYWETYAGENAYDVPFLDDGSVNPDRKVKTQTNNLQVIADYELDKLITQYRFNDDIDDMRRLAFEMEEMLYEHASFVPGWVQPFYRIGQWRWLRYPDGFNVKHSRSDIQYFVGWIDEDMKAETEAAQKSGEVFPPQINVYDQFKEE